MAARDEVPAGRSLAQNWQIIRGTWAQPRPIFMHPGVGQRRYQLARAMEQPLNGVHLGLLVVSGILKCRANNDSPIAARDQINFVASNNVLQLRAANESNHLPFHWAYRKSLRGDAARPSPRAVDHDSGRVRGLFGL